MELLELRPLADRDIPLFEAWVALPHAAPWYEHPQGWVREMRLRHTEFSFLRHFIAVCDGVDVGFGQYYEYRHSGEDWHGSVPLEGTYSIDYLIGDPAFVGRGYGRALIRLLLGAVARLPDAARVIVQPDPDNAASCRTLLSAGFLWDAENRLYLYSFDGLN